MIFLSGTKKKLSVAGCQLLVEELTQQLLLLALPLRLSRYI
jgi:hypothetical protein